MERPTHQRALATAGRLERHSLLALTAEIARALEKALTEAEIAGALERVSAAAPRAPRPELLRIDRDRSRLEADATMAEVVATGTARWRSGRVCVPIGGRPGIVGVLAYAFPEGTVIGQEERDFSETVAVLCALAFDRLRARDAEEDAATLDALFEQPQAAMILVSGPDHVCVRASPAAQLSFQGRLVVGRPAREIIPEAASQGVFELLDHVYRSGETFSARDFSLRLAQPEGLSRDDVFDFAAVPIRHPDGGRSIIIVGADVTSRKRAEERRSLLNEAMMALAATRETQAIARKLAELAVPQLADWCAVDLFDETGAVHRESVPLSPLQGWWQRFPPDSPASAWFMDVVHGRTGTGVVDVTNAVLATVPDRDFVDAVRELEISQAVVVPIPSSQRIVGTLSLAVRRPGRRLDDADAQLATELAQHAGLALDNARLLEHEQQVIGRLGRLQRLTAEFSRAVDPSAVGSVAIGEGMRLLGATTAALYLVEGNRLRMSDHQGVPEESVGEFGDLSIEADVPASRAVRDVESSWIESRADLERVFPAFSKRLGDVDASFATLPLVVEARAIGALIYAFPGAHRFVAEERSLLRTVADQCALALARSRLFATVSSTSHALATIVGASPAVIIVCELDGTVRLWNPAAEQTFGWKSAEVVGRPLPLSTDGEATGFLGTMARISAGKQVVAEEFRVRRKNGEQVDMTVWSAPVSNESGKVQNLLLIADVTERKRVEHELAGSLERERAARADAETANRTKDQFLATMSHELRTPLNAITGWVSMLRAGTLNADMRERALEVIQRNARAQEQLISDLLDMSRVMSGRLRLHSASVRLSDVLGEAVEVMQPEAAAKGVEFALSRDASVALVSGDADRLQQIISNLLTNALKFTPRGGRISVELAQEGARLLVRVSDTGVGIAPEFLPHVFEPFRQADASFARKHRGLGLGLAICKTLVEMHGGTIEAESAGAGRGTTFVVRLPAAGARADATPRVPAIAATARESVPRRLEGVHVLFVEDEPDSRELVMELLEAQGARVQGAATAQAAVEAFKSAKPDVLVSDIGLPGEDGLSLLRRLRELPEGSTVPAAALTAFVRDEDRQAVFAAGYARHVAKPIDADRLIDTIGELAAR